MYSDGMSHLCSIVLKATIVVYVSDGRRVLQYVVNTLLWCLELWKWISWGSHEYYVFCDWGICNLWKISQYFYKKMMSLYTGIEKKVDKNCFLLMTDKQAMWHFGFVCRFMIACTVLNFIVDWSYFVLTTAMFMY